MATAILGAVSLFLANMGRYFQSKRLGIPIRAVHQANIADSADLWVALVGALGFGVFMPIFMLNMNLDRWLLLLVMFLSYTLGLLSTKSSMRLGVDMPINRRGKKYSVNRDMTIVVLSLFALIAAIAYLRLHNMYNDILTAESGGFGRFLEVLGNVAAIVFQSIYALILFLLLLINVLRRMLGSGDVMTTDIDGQNYLIAMRHNQYQWILVPCEVEDYEKEKALGGKGKIGIGVKRVLFDRGAFIMKDLTELREPIIYRTGFSVVEKGKRKTE